MLSKCKPAFRRSRRTPFDRLDQRRSCPKNGQTLAATPTIAYACAVCTFHPTTNLTVVYRPHMCLLRFSETEVGKCIRGNATSRASGIPVRYAKRLVYILVYANNRTLISRVRILKTFGFFFFYCCKTKVCQLLSRFMLLRIQCT